MRTDRKGTRKLLRQVARGRGTVFVFRRGGEGGYQGKDVAGIVFRWGKGNMQATEGRVSFGRRKAGGPFRERARLVVSSIGKGEEIALNNKKDRALRERGDKTGPTGKRGRQNALDQDVKIGRHSPASTWPKEKQRASATPGKIIPSTERLRQDRREKLPNFRGTKCRKSPSV